MRKTALILATAAAFDLGIVAVTAQAQQVTQQPLIRPGTNVPASEGQDARGTTGTGDERAGALGTVTLSGSTDNGVRQSSRDRYIDKSNPVAFIKIDLVNTVQSCIGRRGAVITVDGVQQCRLPATARREEANSAMGAVSTTR
ncbi:MAG: hypothetical protein PSV23_02685 [Brevundimonas sp.]|uniref:hypothetical protein n=1 Tax=Brevundimonas sp. TaxID=1871086 RepID=UPI002486DAD6|nr:hypothetical protein [Brevundimonas sp.]MDI1325684.1 hypothetical protein [Brevundimonas sp.]